MKVDVLPEGVTSMVVPSDLQGREDGQCNRLIGEQVVDELIVLQEQGLISYVDLVILAGDLYDYPDCRKRGGSGMDEITKKIVRRTVLDNPDLSVKFIIQTIRLKQDVGSDKIKLTPYIKDKRT